MSSGHEVIRTTISIIWKESNARTSNLSTNGKGCDITHLPSQGYITRLWVEMGAKKLRSVSEDPLWLVQFLVFVFIYLYAPLNLINAALLLSN